MKFKKGDIVKRVDKVLDGDKDRIIQGETYTVANVYGDMITLEGVSSNYFSCKFILFDERQELSDALDVVIKHGVQVERFTKDGSVINRYCCRSSKPTLYCVSKARLLDVLFPVKTEKEKEIERIEAEMRKLADDLNKLKGEI